MRTRILATAVLGLPAVMICCSLPGVTVAVASTIAPLPASNYTVRPVCAAPAPGDAGCLALRLVAKAPLSVPGARALVRPGSGRTGRAAAPSIIEFKKPIAGSLTPAELLGAYSLNGASPPAGTQTIALIDAYDDPKAESDLATYDKEFKLPECIEASGCFRKVNQEGNKSPLPPSNTEGREPEAGWALETSTDIEVAHAVCQSCRILLVEAGSSELLHLETAEETAVKLLNATEVSNSWGTPECEVGACIGEGSAFHDPGVAITAAAGDNGYLDWATEGLKERGFADYPASLPDVVAVGGTRLLQSHGVWEGENVWNDGGQDTKGEIEGAGAGGGGCSTSFLAKPWQQSVSDWLSVGCDTHRAVADVSADADPYTGVAVYDSTPVTEEGEEIKGWNVLGGTSVASPIIASVFALAGGSHGVEYPAQTLYENLAASPSSLHDVVTGSNGACLKPFEPNNGLSGCTPAEEAANSKCSAKLICLAGPGYDGPTGVGTPNGIAAFQPLTEEAKRKLEEQRAKEKQAEAQKRKEELEAEAKSKSTSAGPAGSSGEESKAPSTTASAGALPTGGSTSLGSPDLAAVLPVLSALTLTRNATAALSRAAPRPKVFRVAFAFTLNVAARVRVTLAKLVVTHGRHRWQTLPYSLTITGAPGRDSARLRARGTLAPGRYRLTLTPVHGTARRLMFKVG